MQILHIWMGRGMKRLRSQIFTQPKLQGVAWGVIGVETDNYPLGLPTLVIGRVIPTSAVENIRFAGPVFGKLISAVISRCLFIICP